MSMLSGGADKRIIKKEIDLMAVEKISDFRML